MTPEEFTDQEKKEAIQRLEKIVDLFDDHSLMHQEGNI